MSMIKFKSKAAADIVMLKPPAEKLLAIMGLTAGERGVIPTTALPSAQAQLTAAIEQERMAKTGQARVDESELNADEKRALVEAVSLEQRAYPLLRMIQVAQEQGQDVHWGF